GGGGGRAGRTPRHLLPHGGRPAHVHADSRAGDDSPDRERGRRGPAAAAAPASGGLDPARPGAPRPGLLSPRARPRAVSLDAVARRVLSRCVPLTAWHARLT